MAAITASMVAELRAKTDAPMMEGSKASKAASRVTAEGVISVFISGQVGALVELNCETDFVAKNDDFLSFSKNVAELVAQKNPTDVAALSALELDGATVGAGRSALIG